MRLIIAVIAGLVIANTLNAGVDIAVLALFSIPLLKGINQAER